MWSEIWGAMIWGNGTPVPLLDSVGWLFLLTALLFVATRYRIRSSVTAMKLVVAIVTFAIPLLAVAGVPYFFTNGTIADADQVNSNFESITKHHSKYTASRSGVNAQSTLLIPDSVMIDLCADHDGCEIQLVSQGRNARNDIPNPAPPMQLFMNSIDPTRWAAIGAAGTVSGIDGDGAIQHVTTDASNDCYFTDGEFAAPPGGGSDATLGFGLLVWTGGTSASRECRLTMSD